jgi:hypothetical protein
MFVKRRIAEKIMLCYAEYMRWEKPGKDILLTHQTAYRIYQDILLSLESYYDDSFTAKFFLPEEISIHCKSVAASFTLLLYTPEPTIDDILNSRMYYLFYLTMMYGAQIYLKERGLATYHAGYKIETDEEEIEKIKNSVTDSMGDTFSITPEASMVMDLYKEQVSATTKRESLQIQSSTFQEKDVDRLIHGSLVFGYLFANEMIRPI